MKTKENQKQIIVEHLKELCLSGIRASYEEITEEARRQSLGYEEYLLELLDRECEIRMNKRIERRLRESRLFLEKTWDSFDTKRLPRKAIQQARVLLEGDFLDRKENVLVFGNPGSGKTHLVNAVAQELIRRKGRKIYFTTTGLLVQDLLAAKKTLKLKNLLSKLGRFDALVLDDIGYVQQSRDEVDVLFTLLAERYERGSVIITSNLAFSKWEMIFKDPMTTAAAIDRLVHHSIIIELNIASYRMSQAKEKNLNLARTGDLDEVPKAAVIENSGPFFDTQTAQTTVSRISRKKT